MNKFETNLLKTLASIDESLKMLATAKQPAPQAVKTSRPAGNGKVPKAVSKTVKSLKAATAKPAPGKAA